MSANRKYLDLEGAPADHAKLLLDQLLELHDELALAASHIFDWLPGEEIALLFHEWIQKSGKVDLCGGWIDIRRRNTDSSGLRGTVTAQCKEITLSVSCEGVLTAHKKRNPLATQEAISAGIRLRSKVITIFENRVLPLRRRQNDCVTRHNEKHIDLLGSVFFRAAIELALKRPTTATSRQKIAKAFGTSDASAKKDALLILSEPSANIELHQIVHPRGRRILRANQFYQQFLHPAGRKIHNTISALTIPAGFVLQYLPVDFTTDDISIAEIKAERDLDNLLSEYSQLLDEFVRRISQT
jgi:hypothetical protein